MYRLLFMVFLFIFSFNLSARENYVDKPRPMEWYRGCTTTAVSTLLDWFGRHGYSNLNGSLSTASYSDCKDAYIRNDIATIYADELGLNCTTNQGASPDEISKGIEKVLTSVGYCVNEDKNSCFQIVNHSNLTIQDLINSIDKGYPLTMGIDSSTLSGQFNFDTDFNRSINHRVVAYGYETSSTNTRISLLSGWSRNWQDATKDIIVSGNEDTIIQERALYITPPYSSDARMITRASAIKRIFDNFGVPNKFGLDSSFTSSSPSDVDNGTSYYKYIATAYNKGIVNGYMTGDLAGKYGAFYSVNRVEFIKMVIETLNKYWGVPISTSSMKEPVNISGNRFSDMDYNSWYYRYVKAAYNYNIIQGTQDGKLQPSLKLSEYEAKIILQRAKYLASSSTNSSSLPYFDGTGSLIDPERGTACSGCGEDLVKLHSHGQQTSAGFFQVFKIPNACESVDLKGLGSATVEVRSWSGRGTNSKYYNATNSSHIIPLNESNDWSLIAFKTNAPIPSGSTRTVTATCLSNNSSNVSETSGTPMKFDNNYFWGGNGSLINHTNNQYSADTQAGYGKNRDTAVLLKDHKTLSVFQITNGEGCRKVRFTTPVSFNLSWKLWNEKNWRGSKAFRNNDVFTFPTNDYWWILKIKAPSVNENKARIDAVCER